MASSSRSSPRRWQQNSTCLQPGSWHHQLGLVRLHQQGREENHSHRKQPQLLKTILSSWKVGMGASGRRLNAYVFHIGAHCARRGLLCNMPMNVTCMLLHLRPWIATYTIHLDMEYLHTQETVLMLTLRRFVLWPIHLAVVHEWEASWAEVYTRSEVSVNLHSIPAKGNNWPRTTVTVCHTWPQFINSQRHSLSGKWWLIS